ncbi:NACHT domain-containing protein [Komarekiella sp. 'clone 1']|uniref:NACHT domain-containing protein n=1 Tax=Komarekiella delphini-convector SJRDD-AB1 TaxID=2593771 RepID=A0AA40VU33_9NOST|nr:HEAT repeat domain-containing protein [Komarekiella delphini-convector]MBD6619727.1 NACHT domain-containing protein [Komarekiella delphini-convector SJRDD-AB1]
MNRTPNSRSIAATPEGLKKVRRRMAELQKSDDEIQNKRGKKCWTQEYLATQSYVDLSTVRRFLKGEAVDESSFQSIIGSLGLNLNDIANYQNLNLSVQIKDNIVDWHKVCSTMLEPQGRITSNPLMQDESAKKERKQIYVPLALVQRTKTDKRNKEDFSPDAGTRLYEPEYETQQRFEHEAFLSQIEILEHGSGKTKGKQIAVIGEPGAGKTTLLQAIASWVLEKDLGLPVWVSLADLGRNGTLTDIQTYICNSWLEQAIPSTKLTQEIRDDFINQIQQGRVWLLLDGVDEISEGSASHQPLEEISRQLTGWVGRSSWVVLTCRLNVWQADRNALETFKTYRLLDFDYPQQVHQFINNWFVEEIEKGERLKTKLDSAERVRLRDMVQTPLRLALLCSIWQSEEGGLPETKAGLYHQCVQQFYKWKQNLFRTSIQEQQHLNQALGRLALRDINEEGSRFRLRETFIIEELGYPDDETSLFYKALKLGWLNHVGIAAESSSKEKVYAFYHATFEEYFAALAVDDWQYFLNHIPENPEQGSYRIFEPQWKEVILLWLGREDIKQQQKEEFIKALLEFEDGCKSQSQIPDWKGFYEYRAYFLAAAGIAEFKDCGLAGAIVKQIVTWRFGYFNIKIQDWQRFHQQIEESTKAFLVEADRKKAITALMELIENSKSEKISWPAVLSLREIAKDNPTAITALVELIRNSQSPKIRIEAASILGIIAKDDPTAITALVELIRDSQSPKIRIEAAVALGRIAKDNPTVLTAFITTLVELIRHSQLPKIRFEAVVILGEIAKDNPTAITALVELIRNSQSPEFRFEAAYILGRIAKDNPTAITALVELIRNSQSPQFRFDVAYILGDIAKDNPTAITALKELTRDSQSPRFHFDAAHILGDIAKDNPTAITALKELARDYKSPEMRNEVTYILGDIAKDNPTAITALKESDHDSKSEKIRNKVASVLGDTAKDNPTAITVLEESDHDSKSEKIRNKVASILGDTAKDNPTAITALVELILDSKLKVFRYLLVFIFREIAKDNPTAITVLEELILDDQSEEIRFKAVSDLDEIAKDNPTAITVLEELTRDSQSEEVRFLVASFLEEINKDNPTAITALEELARGSQSEGIRYLAASSLGIIAKNNPTDIIALEELIRDSQSEGIRLIVALSLGIIAKDNFTAITALMELARDSQSRFIRFTVTSILEIIAKDNFTAITALVKLIRDSQSQQICIEAASSLGKIAKDNPTAITALVELIRDSQSQQICIEAASSLGKIAKDNPTAITALVELIRDSQSQQIRNEAASSLGKIAKDNPTAITALVELIRDSQSQQIRNEAASSLQNLLTESENMTVVVTALKNHLSNEAYKVIWHCTQTMTYLDFYQAWHR